MYLGLLKLFNSALFRLDIVNNFIELAFFFTINKLIVSNYLIFITIMVIFIIYLSYFLKINSLFKPKVFFYIIKRVTICVLILVLFFPFMLIIVKYTNDVSVFLYLLNIDLPFTIGLIFFNRTVNRLTSAPISIYTLKRTFFLDKDMVPPPYLSIEQKEQLDTLHLSLTHNSNLHLITYHHIENIQCFETSNEYITIPSKKVQIVTFLYQKDYYVAFSSQLLWHCMVKSSRSSILEINFIRSLRQKTPYMFRLPSKSNVIFLFCFAGVMPDYHDAISPRTFESVFNCIKSQLLKDGIKIIFYLPFLPSEKNTPIFSILNGPKVLPFYSSMCTYFSNYVYIFILKNDNLYIGYSNSPFMIRYKQHLNSGQKIKRIAAIYAKEKNAPPEENAHSFERKIQNFVGKEILNIPPFTVINSRVKEMGFTCKSIDCIISAADMINENHVYKKHAFNDLKYLNRYLNLQLV